MCGRLICDIKLSAKELIHSKSYDLNTLCEQVSFQSVIGFLYPGNC